MLPEKSEPMHSLAAAPAAGDEDSIAISGADNSSSMQPPAGDSKWLAVRRNSGTVSTIGRMRARRNSMDKRRNSGDIAAGHLRAKDIVHINTSAKGLECMQRLVTPDKVTVMDFLLGLLLYGGSICIFAALLFAISPSGSCYNVEEPAHFGFDTALWISMHSFSTIGFGSIAPAQRCTAAQLIISIESFVALLVYGFISGTLSRFSCAPPRASASPRSCCSITATGALSWTRTRSRACAATAVTST